MAGEWPVPMAWQPFTMGEPARTASGVVVGSAAADVPNDPVILNAGSPHAIPGEFLVALNGDVPWHDVRALAEGLVAKHGGTILAVLEVLPGFGLKATDEQARRFAADPAVDVVEQNQQGELRGATYETNDPMNDVPRGDQR
jgi:hypothetical protein